MRTLSIGAALALLAGCTCATPHAGTDGGAPLDALDALDGGAPLDALDGGAPLDALDALDGGAHAPVLLCETTDLDTYPAADGCAELVGQWSLVPHPCGELDPCPFDGLGMLSRELVGRCAKLAQDCAVMGACGEARAVLDACLTCEELTP